MDKRERGGVPKDRTNAHTRYPRIIAQQPGRGRAVLGSFSLALSAVLACLNISPFSREKVCSPSSSLSRYSLTRQATCSATVNGIQRR